MGYLLSVAVSTRLADSWSIRVLSEFEKAFAAEHPQTEIRHRDPNAIPHLSHLELTAGRTPLDKHSAELSAAFALGNELSDELLGASALVVATPMHNWGPPSALKAWIDRIINVKTFYRDSPALHGIPVTFIVASAGPYTRPDFIAHDHLRPLLREVFSRIGAQDMLFIDCDPTGPLDRGEITPDHPESAWQKVLPSIPPAARRIKHPA